MLVAGAVWGRSVNELTEPAPGREDLADPTKRLFVLTGGLLLPAITLLVDGISDGTVAGRSSPGRWCCPCWCWPGWRGCSTWSARRRSQLAALARSDALTGVPNRRTWDYELSRACQPARDDDRPLTVAVLDLDHFKAYNDTHGHPAGDLLLKEATATWSQHLQPGEVLARYGGEEFAVLLPGHDAESTRLRVLELLASTPGGQTFSAGVATWQPGTDPTVVVAAADRALYNAKRGGRNRVCLAPYVPSGLILPMPRIVLQPIVDLATGEVVGIEALSRFRDQTR